MKLAFSYNLRFKAVIINHNLQSSVSGHQNEYKSIKESVFRLAFGDSVFDKPDHRLTYMSVAPALIDSGATSLTPQSGNRAAHQIA